MSLRLFKGGRRTISTTFGKNEQQLDVLDTKNLKAIRTTMRCKSFLGIYVFTTTFSIEPRFQFLFEGQGSGRFGWVPPNFKISHHLHRSTFSRLFVESGLPASLTHQSVSNNRASVSAGSCCYTLRVEAGRTEEGRKAAAILQPYDGQDPVTESVVLCCTHSSDAVTCMEHGVANKDSLKSKSSVLPPFLPLTSPLLR